MAVNAYIANPQVASPQSYSAGVQDRQREQMNALTMKGAEQDLASQTKAEQRLDKQLSEQQRMQNTQWLAGASQYAMQNPQALPALLEEGKRRGIIAPQLTPDKVTPEALQEIYSGAVAGLGGTAPLGKDDLLAVMGEQGPEYVPASQAVGRQPASSTSTAKPPASISEYQLYREQATQAGEEPMSFYNFRRNISEQEAAGRTSGTVNTKADIEAERERPQKIMAARSRINQIDNTIANIDGAIGMADWWAVGPNAQILQSLGATDARDLRAKLEPIKAALAFDRLQEMRDASKTGGALGQVSERELDLLSGAVQSLDTAQSVGSLLDSLKRVRTHYERLRKIQRGQEALLSGAQFVTTPQEAAQLPPGTMFVDPDGVVRQVPNGQ